MLKKLSAISDSATVVALLGSHSIASAVMNGRSKQAIIEALTICICILILNLPELFTRRLNKRINLSLNKMREKPPRVIQKVPINKKETQRSLASKGVSTSSRANIIPKAKKRRKNARLGSSA